jgi:dsDNA-binding SOS-regulon protein
MKYIVITQNSKIEFSSKAEADAYVATLVNPYTLLSEQETLEISLAKKKREYGLYISNELIERLGARNKILGLTGTQVTQMLTQLAGVRSLLETGALGTARGYMGQFRAAFPSHSDIFTAGINDINIFEQENGL